MCFIQRINIYLIQYHSTHIDSTHLHHCMMIIWCSKSRIDKQEFQKTFLFFNSTFDALLFCWKQFDPNWSLLFLRSQALGLQQDPSKIFHLVNNKKMRCYSCDSYFLSRMASDDASFWGLCCLVREFQTGLLCNH